MRAESDADRIHRRERVHTDLPTLRYAALPVANATKVRATTAPANTKVFTGGRLLRVKNMKTSFLSGIPATPPREGVSPGHRRRELRGVEPCIGSWAKELPLPARIWFNQIEDARFLIYEELVSCWI
jgi:hypothetical protein